MEQEAQSGTGKMEQEAQAGAGKKPSKAERLLARQMAATTVKEVDPLAANYGDVELKSLQSVKQTGRVWTKVAKLVPDLDEQTVLIRGRAQTVRGKGNLGFIVVREAGCTVQCVASVKENVISKQMVKYIGSLNKESIIDVEGVVQIPPNPIAGCTQQVLR
jgi:lysyl-tRNA synthetase class II